jgi:hypothetical protein
MIFLIQLSMIYLTASVDTTATGRSEKPRGIGRAGAGLFWEAWPELTRLQPHDEAINKQQISQGHYEQYSDYLTGRTTNRRDGDVGNLPRGNPEGRIRRNSQNDSPARR